MPGSLGDLLTLIKKSGDVDFIIHCCQSFYLDKIVKLTHDLEKDIKTLSIGALYEKTHVNRKGFPFTAWGYTCRTDFLKENGLYFLPGVLHEDIEWELRMFLNAKSVAFNKNIFYSYRVGVATSIMNTMTIRNQIDKLRIVENLEKEFSSDKYSNEIKAVASRRIQNIYRSVWTNAHHYKKDPRYKELLNFLKKECAVLKGSDDRFLKRIYFTTKHFGARLAISIFTSWKQFRGLFSRKDKGGGASK